MIAMKRVSNSPYRIKFVHVPLNQIANNVKEFPASWIIDGYDISKEFIDYVLPLIKGEPKIKYHDGLIKFATLKK